MSKTRENILLCTLNLADEEILTKELVLYLNENVSTDDYLTPDKMMSVCFMHWAFNSDYEPSDEKITQVRNTITKALNTTYMNKPSYWVIRADLQRKKMNGWKS